MKRRGSSMLLGCVLLVALLHLVVGVYGLSSYFAAPSVAPLPCVRTPCRHAHSSTAQKKVELFRSIRLEQGRSLNNQLKAERGYRNPSFLQKMVDHHEIDQYGSGFPQEIFDPNSLQQEVSCSSVDPRPAAHQQPYCCQPVSYSLCVHGWFIRIRSSTPRAQSQELTATLPEIMRASCVPEDVAHAQS